jgi:hypothetical protein
MKFEVIPMNYPKPRNPLGIGGFKAGVSGNPGGRPKSLAEIQALARQAAPAAVAALVDVLANGKANERVAAAVALLDRGYGKSPQTMSHEDEPSLSSLTSEELAEVMEAIKAAIDIEKGERPLPPAQLCRPVSQARST